MLTEWGVCIISCRLRSLSLYASVYASAYTIAALDSGAESPAAGESAHPAAFHPAAACRGECH